MPSTPAAGSPRPYPFELPADLDGFTAGFLTEVLRHQGWISGTNAIVHMQESGVGMTAGYFSALKRVRCTYREPTAAPASFVIKTWPALEIMPREAIAAYFRKDIAAHASFGAHEFYPRPRVLLAAGDEHRNRWALVMEDAEVVATHKVHETGLTFAETRSLIPNLVDQAVRWEGCDEGPAAARLDAIGVQLWASAANLDVYRTVLAAGAPLLDRMLAMPRWITPTWPDVLGPDFCQEFTRRYGSFFAAVHPGAGATCTLSHGDLRGDNLFLGGTGSTGLDGWLVIDFQLMHRGPVPSDLAYLLTSGSVGPDVYSGENLRQILREFYDAFMARTTRYRAYRFEQFEREFAAMSTVLFVYFVGMGAAYWHAGAFRNELAARVELGNAGATEADLAPEETRQRMWWRKAHANFRDMFHAFDLPGHLRALPLDDPPPVFTELPDHLR